MMMTTMRRRKMRTKMRRTICSRVPPRGPSTPRASNQMTTRMRKTIVRTSSKESLRAPPTTILKMMRLRRWRAHLDLKRR